MNKLVASPLRYPGGKSCLIGLVSEILRANKLDCGHYVEPYAGGCGLALSLLYEGNASDIHINDIDPAIWSFWYSALYLTTDFLSLVMNTATTLDEWHRQRQIHQEMDCSDPLRLGFATFFLNRTNRSGVIKGAGVIGGRAQAGNYKMDCRFNKEELSRRIARVAKYKGRIHLSNMDAVDFMRQTAGALSEPAFFCVDPPYFNKGSSLYTSFYGEDEHAAVAQAVMSLRHCWIVTYDATDEIMALYKKRRQFLFKLNYSVQTKRVGSELLVASTGLKIPDTMLIEPSQSPALPQLALALPSSRVLCG